MVSYFSTKTNMCNSHSYQPCQKIIQNDEEGSEIEFEGWLQLGNPVREIDNNFNGRCQRYCSMNSPQRHIFQNENNCCVNQDINNVSGINNYNNTCSHLCGQNTNTFQSIRRPRKCLNCNGLNNGHGTQIRNENEIYYVNNKQNAPTVVVQKPQTVVVRNKSRPPIVVQQPPPNVIVKNDPPQPIYVQNLPPNITVKNSEPTGYRNLQFLHNNNNNSTSNNNLDKINRELTINRQFTCGIPRNNHNSTQTYKRNHCIYHCKHPCYVNL